MTDPLIDVDNWEWCTCLDCGVPTTPPPPARHEWYMVHDHIWEMVVDGDGYLCIPDLEKRLGRRLTPADFTGAPVNRLPWATHATDRLNERRGIIT